jgi:hypothetical protein
MMVMAISRPASRTPQGRSDEELQANLSERQPPHYELSIAWMRPAAIPTPCDTDASRINAPSGFSGAAGFESTDRGT